MFKFLLPLLMAASVGACVSTGGSTSSMGAVGGTSFNLRQEIFVFEANNAVTAAIAGKRPTQWGPAVMDLYHAGKAKPATCVKMAVLWFTHMHSMNAGARVEHHLPQGSYDIASYNPTTRYITRTGVKEPLVHRPVNDPGFPGPRHFQEVSVPLQGGIGAVFVPAQAIRASDNPVMGIALPGFAIRGLPEGNDSGMRTSVRGIPESKDGIRWSTPRNSEFKTGNELHTALDRPNKNNVAAFVVPPC